MKEIQPKELEIIDAITRITGNSPAFSDDAYYDSETRQIYTTDTIVEGVHFSLDYFSAFDVGWKAAAVNHSDVAAMGGYVKYLLVSVGLPSATSVQWVKDCYRGIKEVCNQFGGQVIGGDTVSSPDRITLSVTAIGACLAGHPPGHRYNAAPGDIVLTTGFHGLSAIGLQCLRSKTTGFLAAKKAHLNPVPQIAAANLLTSVVKHNRYALTDSSDGLADAAIKIAQASGVSIMLNASHIALHLEILSYYQQQSESDQSASQQDRATTQKALKTALFGGEDFQLVATVPEKLWHNTDIQKDLVKLFTPCGQVREAMSDDAVSAFLLEDNNQLPQKLTLFDTYQHFNLS